MTTFDLSTLFLAGVAYLLLLFLIAFAVERGRVPQVLIRHPAVYALSLGVYTTTWSYYGSVGFAGDNGFLYLAVYLGPTLACLVAPLLLAPLVRLVRDYQLTSLADLLALRYNSQAAGILVTLLMLAGSLPYIALQIRAVGESMAILTGDSAPTRLGLLFCGVLMVFAILFGARHVSAREKHQGLVVAIAFESLVKLAALLAVAGFALFGVFDGPGGLEAWLTDHPEALDALYRPLEDGPWGTLLLLSFAAAFLLPRQFHMGFVENLGGRSLSWAGWAFPLYLLLFNLGTPVILWAGQSLQARLPPDYYLLGVALNAPSPWLGVLAFIGGISAASAMAIVSTLALSSMALNHLLLPTHRPDPSMDLYRWLLWARRTLIVLILLVSYGLYLALEHNQGLVELGLISFVAVVQCLPGLVGVLYWRRATRTGFLLGLGAGIVIWYLALLMPLLHHSGLMVSDFDLLAWLGGPEGPPWAGATFWTLTVNTLLFVLASLLTRPDEGQRRAVAACFEGSAPEGRRPRAGSPAEFSRALARTLGRTTARREVARALTDLQLAHGERRPRQLERLRERIERNLSGMLGPLLARMIVRERLDGDTKSHTLLTDHLRFVEERLEHSRTRLRGLARELDALHLYHRQILRDLPLGACSVSGEGEILNWNQALVTLTAIGAEAAEGARLETLPAPWGRLLAAFLAYENQHIRKTRVVVAGRPRWLNLHKAAIGITPYAGSGPRGGAVLLVEDLTELQTLEAELAHTARLASVGRLAAGVAHEIGNPVTGIACLAQNLREEDDPRLIRDSIEEILVQTRRIDAILRTLATFSHSGNSGELRPEAVLLVDLVADAQRLVSLSRTGKQLQHRNEIPRELILEVDRQRLLQVLVNLLTNACDASCPGQTIRVVARTRADDTVDIIVEDQGEGIPEDLRERIFEPFFTTKDPGRGTGLGLPMVYQIVRDHGGSVRVDSTQGRGTRIILTLPRQRPPLTVTNPDHAIHSDH